MHMRRVNGKYRRYPLVICYSLLLKNGPVEKNVSFPINSMLDLSIVFCMFRKYEGYTHVNGFCSIF